MIFDKTLRAEIAERVWLERCSGDDYWSHMVAPRLAPDAESERIADAVVDLLRDRGVEVQP